MKLFNKSILIAATVISLNGAYVMEHLPDSQGNRVSRSQSTFSPEDSKDSAKFLIALGYMCWKYAKEINYFLRTIFDSAQQDSIQSHSALLDEALDLIHDTPYEFIARNPLLRRFNFVFSKNTDLCKIILVNLKSNQQAPICIKSSNILPLLKYIFKMPNVEKIILQELDINDLPDVKTTNHNSFFSMLSDIYLISSKNHADNGEFTEKVISNINSTKVSTFSIENYNIRFYSLLKLTRLPIINLALHAVNIIPSDPTFNLTNLDKGISHFITNKKLNSLKLNQIAISGLANQNEEPSLINCSDLDNTLNAVSKSGSTKDLVLSCHSILDIPLIINKLDNSKLEKVTVSITSILMPGNNNEVVDIKNLFAKNSQLREFNISDYKLTISFDQTDREKVIPLKAISNIFAQIQ